MNTFETDAAFVAHTYARFPLEIVGGKGSVLTGSDVNKSLTVTCNIQMDLSLLGEINTTARMCIWAK